MSTYTRPGAVVVLTAGVLALGALAGCDGGSAVDVAGTYTLSLTDGKNDCQIGNNWTEGKSATGIQFVISEAEGKIYGEVKGIPAIYLGLATGTATFNGSASGSSLNLEIVGKPTAAIGNCDYSLNITAQVQVSGDFISGTLTYTYATDHATDCGFRETCQSVQSLNGTRPPKP